MLSTFLEIIRDNIRNLPVTLSVAWFQLQREHKTTDLGWFWAIVKPILYVCMFYAAISLGFKHAKSIDGIYCSYFVWLTSGLVPWFYLSPQILGGASCFRRQRRLFKRTNFPIAAIPMIGVVKALFVHCILIVMLLVFAMLNGVRPSLCWLQLPFYMILMIIFCYFWCFTFGLLGLLSGDFISFIKSIRPAFFWLSGIFFNSRARKNHQMFFICNPITCIVEGYRNCICYNMWFWEEPLRFKALLCLLLLFMLTTVILYKRLGRYVYELS